MSVASNWPRCEHGVPRGRYCGPCNGDKPRRETSLVADLAAAAPKSERSELHLPPTAGHEPRIERAKGKWTVTCSCGGFRERGSDAHDLEAAWGRHRHT